MDESKRDFDEIAAQAERDNPVIRGRLTRLAEAIIGVYDHFKSPPSLPDNVTDLPTALTKQYRADQAKPAAVERARPAHVRWLPPVTRR